MLLSDVAYRVVSSVVAKVWEHVASFFRPGDAADSSETSVNMYQIQGDTFQKTTLFVCPHHSASFFVFLFQWLDSPLGA
jgi:hypothetical protein